jgi:uncharacterized ubiquitin-like protein YukD
MEEKAIVIFNAYKKNICVDIEIPTDITARELICALNFAYSLEIDTENETKCHLQMENPIALLRGNKILKDCGIRNGSIIYYTE